MISARGRYDGIIHKKAKNIPRNAGLNPNYDQFDDDDEDDYEPPERDAYGRPKEVPIVVNPPANLRRERAIEEEEEEEVKVEKQKDVRKQDAFITIPDPEGNDENSIMMDFWSLFSEMTMMNQLDDPIIILDLILKSDQRVFFPYAGEKYPMNRDLLRKYMSRWINYEIEGFKVQFQRVLDKLSLEKEKLTSVNFFKIVNDYSQYIKNIPEFIKMGEKWVMYEKIKNEQRL